MSNQPELDGKASVSRFDVEREEDWREMINHIPYLDLGKNILIQPIPPFGGAVCRFTATMRDQYGERYGHVSVYIDWYSVLGLMDGPYWEVYPNERGDNERFDLDDAVGVARCIKCSLYSQRDDND